MKIGAIKSCIIVSPYFPPSTLAGVHRARLLAKHLPAAGWEPIIVCVDENYHEQRLDPGLASLVPPWVEIVKVSAFSASYCRTVGLGDISLRAWQPLRQAVIHLLETRRIGAVLITGSPYYPMLLATEIKRRFGVPIVLDFQDPWVSAWGVTQQRWSKAGLAHSLAKILEPKAIRAADFITSVSDTQNADMRARYPWLDAERMGAIPIGGDPADYNAVRADTVLAAAHASDPTWVDISYVGTIWPPVIGTLRAFLVGVHLLKETAPELFGRLRLNFVGTTARPEATQDFKVMPLAHELGVSDAVHEVPERIPYLDALAFQSSSHCILLIGSNEPHYTASKIYAVMMSGRPFLSVFHAASSSHQILSQAGGGIAVAFNTPEELADLPPKIAEALVRLVTNPERLGRANPSAYANFTASAIASRFAAIFDQLHNESRTQRGSGA